MLETTSSTPTFASKKGAVRPDFAALRALFPALHQEVNGKPLAYLDSAASSQMPQSVIDTLVRYHSLEHSNVHRGVHTLSQLATTRYEDAREKVRAFINAPSGDQVIWTSGTTESLNLVANAWGNANIKEGDEIVLTTMEHHSNIVPWQLLAKRTGARIRVVPISDEGVLDMDALARMLSSRTKVVGAVHISNALGTINPVDKICQMAREVGAISVIDGAQAVPHMAVDVAQMGCDFYAFSGHKMLGPTGIGVLYGRREILEAMEPWKGGGDMILTVSLTEGSTFAGLPCKFEAGTPSIAAAVGLGAAIDFIEGVGREHILAHENALVAKATSALEAIEGVRVIGTAPNKASVVSFVMDGVHPHDVGSILDSEGVAVRAGHHCAQPVMERFGVPATARASFALYNNESDIDALVRAIRTVKEIFG